LLRAILEFAQWAQYARVSHVTSQYTQVQHAGKELQEVPAKRAPRSAAGPSKSDDVGIPSMEATKGRQTIKIKGGDQFIFCPVSLHGVPFFDADYFLHSPSGSQGR